MRIVRYTRLDELNRIERLLCGINYVVWLNLYGPADSDLGLADALKILISKDCELSGVAPSSPEEAVSEIMNMVLYKGDSSSGPLDLDLKKPEITELMGKVFLNINVENADMVVDFGLKNGHPACPVFWDFSYDIHSNGKRWIFMGSSSD